MRKEILFAILAGVIFGIVIAFGIWRANVAFKPSSSETQESVESVVDQDVEIVIAKPENFQVTPSAKTTISGLTKPNLQVVVSAEEEDYLTQSDDKGKFEVEIDLISGLNEIIVASIDKDANITRQKVTVIYSQAFAKYLDE